MVIQERIKLRLEQGIDAREAGDYAVGQKELRLAFNEAIETGDGELIIEAGNQYSIQCRLIAGRAIRKGDTKTADTFSNRSLDVFTTYKELSLFDLKDPGTARGWSHALLYAGKVNKAIKELKHSVKVQDNPAARGDEICHLASAHHYQGNLDKANELVEKGIKLIKENKGSPIWLTYGLMTKASILVHEGREKKAKLVLNEALEIAKDKKLAVREEEINYLLSKEGTDINVLKVVGNFFS